jgi:hypothetical protein
MSCLFEKIAGDQVNADLLAGYRALGAENQAPRRPDHPPSIRLTIRAA